MKEKYSNRIKEITLKEKIVKKLHDYSYLETIVIVLTYIGAGYIIDPDDILLLNGEVLYVLIILSILTLFHGFENGMIAVAIIAIAMWVFYEEFAYIKFLVTLMMVMLFSEFHYYWTGKIRAAEIDANYKASKLDELSKAFYSLKISHDQLEKNYVVKPMSIRNSILHILHKTEELAQESEVEIDRTYEYYKNFIDLLSKSFNVEDSIILYKKDSADDKFLDYKNANMVLGENSEDVDMYDVFNDYLVARAIERKTAIYVSDEKGEPSAMQDRDSNYIGAIPAVQDDQVVAVLVIKKMPFMSFNREILTSIAILLDYFSVEIRNKNTLAKLDEVSIIPDEEFRYEYTRLRFLYKRYNVNSIVLIFRINNELQAVRIYEKITRMLRSLDMVTLVPNENAGLYYVVLMFPLNDKSAALGFYNRLLNTLDEAKDKKFNFMTFDMSQVKLLNKYLREDYSE